MRPCQFISLRGYLLVGCTLILLQGCGSDPGTSALMGDFVPTSHNLGLPNVNITHNIDQSLGTVMALNITVQSGDKLVYTAAFDLTFDPNIIEFLKLEPGGFLEETSKNGVAYLANMDETQPNVLVVGISQGGDDPGRAGSGVLATASFRLLKPDCTEIKFVERDSNNVKRSELLTPDNEEINILWSGGKLTVRLEGNTDVCVPDPQSP